MSRRGTYKFIFVGLITCFMVGVGNANISLEIKRVALSQKAFDASRNETVDLSFEVTCDASVTVEVYDWLGQKVRSLMIADAKTGRNNVTWDGKRQDGNVAAGEVFLYVIKAKTTDGQKALYNPARETGGIEVEPHAFDLNWDAGDIEYVLPKSCMVRIRAGFKEGMLGLSVIDWSPKAAGRHKYAWDGLDASGKMNLLRHKDLDIRLTCYTLPSNAVIVTGQTVPFKLEGADKAVVGDRRDELWGTAGKYKHYCHNPLHCRRPEFTVSFPTGKEIAGTEGVTVSGIVPIRVELDSHDAISLLNSRFEVMLFIDGVYIFETEEGSNPFTFNWDTKGLMKGPHVITVNILSYDDHIGIQSSRVIIEESL